VPLIETVVEPELACTRTPAPVASRLELELGLVLELVLGLEPAQWPEPGPEPLLVPEPGPGPEQELVDIVHEAKQGLHGEDLQCEDWPSLPPEPAVNHASQIGLAASMRQVTAQAVYKCLQMVPRTMR